MTTDNTNVVKQPDSEQDPDSELTSLERKRRVALQQALDAQFMAIDVLMEKCLTTAIQCVYDGHVESRNSLRRPTGSREVAAKVGE